jgi:hypothetical protein
MRQTGKIWTDHNGKEVPTYAISPVIKAEDKHAAAIERAALRVEKALQSLDSTVRAGYEEIYEAKLRDAKVFDKAPPPEGMTISSFDRKVEVKITKPDNLYFDETYTQIVKEKFEEYFATFDDNETIRFLRDIVNSLLFSSRGRMDMTKVMSLRQYRDRLANSPKLSKNAEVFLEAMDLFDKAVRKKPGRMGIYVTLMDDKGKKRRVPLKYTDV